VEFDERDTAKNNFAAVNARVHRMSVKDVRYTFCQKETFTDRGGQTVFRTRATVRRDVELLRRKWGDVFNSGGKSGTDYAGVHKFC
jgi:hypothetical protein